MANAEHKGLIARWLEGKERSEDYARSTLPTNRWSLFWDILKGRLGKLILINLLVLVTFAPIVAILIFRYISIIANGAVGPFGSGLGVGYPVIPEISGAAELLLMRIDNVYYALLLPAAFIAALGLSGAVVANVMNLLATIGGPNILGILLFVIVLPIGTVLNLAISVLGAFVHTARLQYIEFFGKFYEEGGRHFEPYRVNAKHVSIVADEKYGE